jgi:hypothetical protein
MSARDDFDSLAGRGRSKGRVTDIENAGVARRKARPSPQPAPRPSPRPVAATPVPASDTPPPMPRMRPEIQGPQIPDAHPAPYPPRPYWGDTRHRGPARSNYWEQVYTGFGSGFEDDFYTGYGDGPGFGQGPQAYDAGRSPPVDRRTGKFIQFYDNQVPGLLG